MPMPTETSASLPTGAPAPMPTSEFDDRVPGIPRPPRVFGWRNAYADSGPNPAFVNPLFDAVKAYGQEALAYDGGYRAFHTVRAGGDPQDPNRRYNLSRLAENAEHM